MIQVGQVQELVYLDEESITDGDRSFYLADAQKEALRLDTEVVLPLNKKVGHREITKKELVDALMNTDHGRDNGRLTLSKMLVRDLHKLAANLGINTKLVTHQMKPGWAGKGKGLLQVLWEHGWIDESKIARYKKIVTDDAGFIVK